MISRIWAVFGLSVALFWRRAGSLEALRLLQVVPGDISEQLWGFLVDWRCLPDVSVGFLVSVDAPYGALGVPVECCTAVVGDAAMRRQDGEAMRRLWRPFVEILVR